MFIVLLLILSCLGVAASLLIPGADDYLLLAVPCLVASVVLWVVAVVRQRASAKTSDQKWVILDGSNIMYWRNGQPDIATVREVLMYLVDHGYTPGVMFDANVGYLLSGTYQHDGKLAHVLGLLPDRVMVVPKGTPADLYILKAARDLGAQIVTNDRYRDWVTEFPEIAQQGHLIRGKYSKGQVWLDLDKSLNANAA